MTIGLTLDFETAVKGTIQSIVYRRSIDEICPVCKGTGKFSLLGLDVSCLVCEATGRTQEKRVVKVKIAAGITEGTKIRLRGAGDVGFNGGSSGDLYVTVSISPHPYFSRSGNNIIYTFTPSKKMAMFGAEVKIATLDGFVKIQITNSTTNGQIFRFPTKGIPQFRGNGRGDFVVKVRMPWSKAELEKLKQDLPQYPLHNRWA